MRRRYDLSRLSVMLIDDHGPTLWTQRTVILNMRIRDIRIYENAVDAFQQLETWIPDLIITDWKMEPLSGAEFIRLVRGLEGPARFTPIIVLTGQPSRALVGRARDVGADYTLAKPVSVATMYKAIGHMLHGDRTFVQVGQYFGPDRRRKSRPFEFEDRRQGADAPPGDASREASGKTISAVSAVEARTGFEPV